MAWNPLKRQTLPKGSTTGPSMNGTAEEKEVENLIIYLNNITETSRQLYKEGKKFTEFVHEVSKSENRLTHELLQSPVCFYDDNLRNLVEEYHSVTSQSQAPCDDLILVLQKALVEPMKKYNQMVVGVQMKIRKREQAVQECQRLQARLEKLQGKEKTGPVVAKLAAAKKSLEAAEKEVKILNETLKIELPQIFAARFDYFQPCLEALIKAKVNYCGKFSLLLNDLVKTPLAKTSISDERFKTQVDAQLAEIRALSIIAND